MYNDSGPLFCVQLEFLKQTKITASVAYCILIMSSHPPPPYRTVYLQQRSRLVPCLTILVFVCLCLHLYTIGLYFNRHLFLSFFAQLAAALPK